MWPTKRQMNNQKDTKGTKINSYGQANVSENKALSNMSVYDMSNKKTEKLVTALYLVTDCMEKDDALKERLRLLGVELLSDIYKYSTLSPVEKTTFVFSPISKINEILSFIEVASVVGFISEMNSNILKKEFSKLVLDLKESVSKDKLFTFTIDEKMFEEDQEESFFLSEKNLGNVKNNFGEARPYESKNFIRQGSKIELSNRVVSKPDKGHKKIDHQQILKDKEERASKIIALVKDKKDVTIKDISMLFSNVSEKTIQRELNVLVSKGQLKKTGSKRWSRYQLVVSE